MSGSVRLCNIIECPIHKKGTCGAELIKNNEGWRELLASTQRENSERLHFEHLKKQATELIL